MAKLIYTIVSNIRSQENTLNELCVTISVFAYKYSSFSFGQVRVGALAQNEQSFQLYHGPNKLLFDEVVIFVL